MGDFAGVDSLSRFRVLVEKDDGLEGAALRSYKRLEKDFVVSRREVIDSPDEVFEEEIEQV